MPLSPLWTPRRALVFGTKPPGIALWAPSSAIIPSVVSDERVWGKALGGLYARGDVIASKYRLDRVVGVGGMGVVVEAHHLELEQPVAVKLLRPTRMSDDNRERFRREAQAAFRLTSEHAVRILDLGQHGETLYMAMELLDGSDFGQILQAHGRLEVATAVGYVLQVCEAVAEAHAVGVVHRDLKPENLFLCTRADGTPCVKVLDFGLAKLRGGGSRASLTRVNRGMGTPHYMAPEQWLSARDVGPGADIWGIGVILFQLIAGAKPFDDEDEGALCQSVLFSAPTDLDRFVPNPPPGLADVIMRCLEKKPNHRYQTVGDLAAALLPYAPRGPVEVLSGDEVPMPGVAASWGLSLSEPSKTRVDPVRRPERDSVTTVQAAPSLSSVDSVEPPALAGETAEAMPPSIRPHRMDGDFDSIASLGDAPSEDTSEPVVGEVRNRQAERPKVLWALPAVVLGGIVAAVVFSGVLDSTGETEASAPAAGEGQALPEPTTPSLPVAEPAPTAIPDPIEEPANEDVVDDAAEQDGAAGGSASEAEEGAGGASGEGDGDLDDADADPPKPPPRIYYRPRPRPKPKPSDIYEDI